MPIRWLTGMQKLENGQTKGRCNVCKMEFVSIAGSQRAAQDELRKMFDSHVCRSGNETHSNVHANRSEGQNAEDVTGH
jgi:hypothetical protein